MSDRGSETRVILKRYATDTPLDLVGIFLAKILYDIEFYFSAAFARKSVNGIDVPDGFECLAHQYETFFFDLDDTSSRMGVRLEWISSDRSRCGRRLIKKYRDGDVALFPQ